MALTAALAVAVVVPVPSSAQQADIPPNRFQVSPTLQIATGRPPAGIPPTSVANTTPLTYRVTVRPVRLRQSLSGQFDYRTRPADFKWAELVLDVPTARFDLPSGQSRSIDARWLGMPPEVRAAPVGIAVVGRAIFPGDGESSIGTRVQVIRLNFLSLPGGPRPKGRLPLVRAEQVGPRKLQIQTRVRNIGKQFEAPRRGLLVIRRAGGGVVQRTRWDGGGRLGFVIPGAQREYPVKVSRLLPAGLYIVDSWAYYGGERLHVRGRFRLVGPNELPTPSASVVSLDVEPNPGSPRFTLTVRNTGNVPITPTADVTLSPVVRKTRGKVVARERFRGEPIPPRETGTISGRLGDVQRGVWELRAQARVGDSVLPVASNRFSVQPKRGWLDRFKNWLENHTALAIAIGAAVLLALLLLVIVLMRLRYKRRLEEMATATRRQDAPPEPEPSTVREPAPAPEPDPERQPARPPPVVAPAPSASDGQVSLNSASVDELMTLPGVGRRAAERIVESREADGPFQSIDDLSRVEAFHTERVDRLRPWVRL